MHLIFLFLFFIKPMVWGLEVQVPALTSPVVDMAEMLKPGEEQNLSSLIYEIHTHNGPQITILTVPDLQGFTIEDFSIKVVEKWKLGTKQKDNGLLILISKNERKMRIEVGQGLEGDITDYEANLYIRKVLTPAFKRGDFHGGLQEVIINIGQVFNVQLTGRSNFPIRRALPPEIHLSKFALISLPILMVIFVIGQFALRKRKLARGFFSGGSFAGFGYLLAGTGSLGFLLFLFILGLVIGAIGVHNVLYALASANRRSGYRGGGGFGGGGGWSGGGGGFSGGGSSGSW